MINKEPKEIALSLSADIIVLLGLILVNKIFGKYRDDVKDTYVSYWVCHLWFWLMIISLIVAYIFGTSSGYVLISGNVISSFSYADLTSH